MKNIKFLLAGFVFVAVLMSAAFVSLKKWQEKETVESEIHFHAGFQVYVNDQKQNFSDMKYMHIMPCGEEDHDEDEQQEKAHLHDGVGDVVHVHREGALWKDLFQNISYTLPNEVVGYVNGQRVPQILSMPILANSSVVFFVGENGDTEKKLAERVTQEQIQQVEGKSESCGS